MGTYNSTYIGPYLIVNNSDYKSVETIYTTKSGRIHKKLANFDSETGEPIISTTKEVIKKQRGLPMELNNDIFSEALETKDYVIYILNKKSNYSYIIDDYDTHQIPFDIDITSIIDTFITDYSKELNLFSERGIIYEIKYGVVNYCS